MIELPTYDIAPPDEAVRTPTIQKPTPDSDELDILEMNQILAPFDRAVLFSCGDDSLALTHYAFENDLVDVAIHLDTGSSIPANIDYVREVCRENCWPLILISSPMPFDTFAMRYGFPGASCHTMAYHAFKGRQLGYINTQTDGSLKFLSGVRTDESDRRMKNITAEVQYADDTNNFDGWWVSPMMDWSDDQIATYREEHDLRRNPVAEKIHRSGDCSCLAYGHRDEELILLQSEYPDFAEWLLNVENRVAEYRGRVFHLEDAYPEVADAVQEIRTDTRPYPMRLSVLKDHYPDVYDDIVAVDAADARARGKTDETSYIGHGGMSSQDLRSLMADADISQQTLCENCGSPADSLAASVERNIEAAADAINTDPSGHSTTQVKLTERPTDPPSQ
jgi:3'-phosphoadenosine 5'-phosphosulfate sulfotransferase (PAPS reductase)/FAD synthetase